MTDTKDCYTLTEFAKKAVVSKNAISKAIKAGKIEVAERVGTAMLIKKSELEKYKAIKRV